jgi:hypothetical protein
MLPVFARPEACPPCYYVNFGVGGVMWFSGSVGVVGEARPTVAKNAVYQEGAKTTAKPKENIAKPKMAKKPTGRLKTAADTVKIEKITKTWMMLLQHLCVHGLRK